MNEKDVKYYPYSRTGVRCAYCRQWFRLRTPDDALMLATHLTAEQAARHAEVDERQGSLFDTLENELLRRGPSNS